MARSIGSIVALVALVVAMGFVAHGLRSANAGADAQIRENGGIPWAQRQIQGAFGLQISRDFIIEAQALIPAGATYAVRTGPNLGNEQQPVWSALTTYIAYALQPRQTATDADWLLCYGCELSRYSAYAQVAWQDGGLVIARRTS